MADEQATDPEPEAGDAVTEQAADEAVPQEGVQLEDDADIPHFVEAWSTYDPSLRFTALFPLTSPKGATESCAAYYIIEPGRHSGLHSDNAEEIVFVTEGIGEVYIMGGSRKLEAGQFHVFPAGVPHDVYAHGGSALRILSFFPTSEIVSTYQETMFPMGTPVLTSRRPGPVVVDFGPDGAPDNVPAAIEVDAEPQPDAGELSPLARAIGMKSPADADASDDSSNQPED